MKPVNDPELLAQLNGPVSDPELLAQLNAPEDKSFLDTIVDKAKAVGSDYQDFSEGLGVAGLETYYGLKDLLGMGEEEDRKTLQAWKDAANESGWGTGGHMIGELAQLAIPGGMGLKAAKALNAVQKAARTAKALPFVADVAGSAAHGAIKLPGEDETRTDEAFKQGAAAVSGGVLGKALKIFGVGLKVSPEARRMIDAGVKVTPGQAVPFLKRAEDIAEVTPFLARSVKKAKKRARETFHNAALHEGAPVGTVITESGHKGVNQVREAVEDQYSKAWQGQQLAPGSITKIKQVAREGMKTLPTDEAAVVGRALQNINKIRKEGGTAHQLDKAIRRRLTPSASYDLTDTLRAMRDTLRAGLPETASQQLRKADEAWPKLLVLRNAAATVEARNNKGIFDPAEFMTGVGQIGKKQTGYGKAPLQSFGDDAMATVGLRPGSQPLSWLRRISDISPTIWPMQTTADYLTGQGIGQDKLRRMLESELADKLRYGVSPARAYAAYEE